MLHTCSTGPGALEFGGGGGIDFHMIPVSEFLSPIMGMVNYCCGMNNTTLHMH